jgi:hypothetical protein
MEMTSNKDVISKSSQAVTTPSEKIAPLPPERKGANDEEAEFARKMLLKYPLAGSISEIEVSSSGEIKLPFQTMIKAGQTFVGLPSNFEENCEKQYLFRAVSKLIEKGVYHTVHLEKTYSSKLKLGASEELFLKGFILQVFNKTLVELPSSKTPLYHGILAAQKYIISAKDNLDITLFKQCHAKQPSAYIFGDVYGKDYPIEKKILDKLIHILRTWEYEVDVQKYLIPWNEVVKEKGLSIDLSSDTLEEDEKSYIRLLIEENKMQAQLESYSGLRTLDDVLKFQGLMQKDQKALKQIKTCIDTMVSERITACFAPYQGAARQKARKIKLSILMENAKSDKDQFKHFNPTMVLIARGVPRMIDTIPASWSNEDIDSFLLKTRTIITGTLSASESISQSIFVRYRRYLNV